MSTRTGMSSIAALAGVIGLAAMGLGGYNFMKTGCPLGTVATSLTSAAGEACPLGACSDKTQAEPALLVAADAAKKSCCGGCKGDNVDLASLPADCCSKTGAAVTTVAAPAKADGACATPCSDKAACSDATKVVQTSGSAAKSCSDKAGCSDKAACSDAAKVVPTSGSAAKSCSDKAGCSDKAACGEKKGTETAANGG